MTFGVGVIQAVLKELMYMELLQKWHEKHWQMQVDMQREMEASRTKRINEANRQVYVKWWTAALSAKENE
jgi:hypothetical protein